MIKAQGASTITFFFNKIVQNITFYSLYKSYDPSEKKAKDKKPSQRDIGEERVKRGATTLLYSFFQMTTLFFFTLGPHVSVYKMTVAESGTSERGKYKEIDDIMSG